jgi:hypothetical protein
MARGCLFGSSLVDSALQGSRVHVTQLQYFLCRQPFVDQLLFHLDHIIVRHLTEHADELRPHLLWCFTFVQLQNHMLQELLASLRIVDEFAHVTLSPYRAERGSLG